MSKSEKCTKINKDNDSKMSYNGVAYQPKEHRGVVVLWITAYTILKQFTTINEQI